jgi:hypothetical protein
VVLGILEFGICDLGFGRGHRVYSSLRNYFSIPLNSSPSGPV